MTNSFDDIQNNKMTITQIAVSLSVDIYIYMYAKLNKEMGK